VLGLKFRLGFGKLTPIGRPVSRGKYALPRRNEIASFFKQDFLPPPFVLQVLIVPVSSLCWLRTESRQTPGIKLS